MPDPELSQMCVSMYSTSADAASKLKISDMFDLDTSKTTRVLFLEALVRNSDEDEAYEMDGDTKVVQYLVRKAFGVRITLQVSGWSAETSLSISSVAAKAQVEGQSVQYHVETLGLPEELEDEVIEAVGITGPLNENSFVALRKLVTELLPQYLRKRPAKNPDASRGERSPLKLVEYRVPIEDGADSFDVPRSIHYAMTHLARGDTLAQAKEALRGSALARGVGSEVVEEIYRKYGGISPSQDRVTPPPDSVMVARRWLNFQPSSA
jgi:hypothetical protein